MSNSFSYPVRTSSLPPVLIADLPVSDPSCTSGYIVRVRKVTLKVLIGLVVGVANPPSQADLLEPCATLTRDDACLGDAKKSTWSLDTPYTSAFKTTYTYAPRF